MATLYDVGPFRVGRVSGVRRHSEGHPARAPSPAPLD